jgi:hypothetical protein
MAMSTIADNDLSTVTGQSGVSIGVDLTLNIDFDTLAWGDGDGVGAGTTAGWVGWANGDIQNLHIRLRGDLLQYNKLLTIDTYTDAANKSYVRIGIPSMNVTMESFPATVGAWSNTTVAGHNAPDLTNFQEFGTMNINGLQILFANNGGYVDISSTASTVTGSVSGVKFTAHNVKIDELNIASMTWGDRDGAINDDTTAGYAGLANLAATDILINANLTINVATTNATAAGTTAAGQVLAGLSAADQALLTALGPNLFNNFGAGGETAMKATFAAVGLSDQQVRDLGDRMFGSNASAALFMIATGLHERGTIGQSYVEFGLDANVHIGSLYTKCVVGPQADLRAAASSDTFGEWYISNLNVVIPAAGSPVVGGTGVAPQSWVAIAAH